MAEAKNASVKGKPLACPVCGGDRFGSKPFMVTGKWLQSLNLEVLGDKGIMLICQRCSYIQSFANEYLIELFD